MATWLVNDTLFVYGGQGTSDITQPFAIGYLNDMWSFNLIDLTWSFLSSTKHVNSDTPDTPGARAFMGHWLGGMGGLDLWIFGGEKSSSGMFEVCFCCI